MSFAEILSPIATGMGALALGLQWYQWRKSRAESKEWQQIVFARELTDRIIARQDRLDDYLENVSNGKTEYIYERHLDHINSVLRECEYFGSLVEQEKIEESELLGHDRHYVAEIWSELNIRGQALCDDIRDEGLANSHSRKILKFKELLRLITKRWGPKSEEKKNIGQ
jgi:hypothetical protein